MSLSWIPSLLGPNGNGESRETKAGDMPHIYFNGLDYGGFSNVRILDSDSRAARGLGWTMRADHRMRSLVAPRCGFVKSGQRHARSEPIPERTQGRRAS